MDVGAWGARVAHRVAAWPLHTKLLLGLALTLVLVELLLRRLAPRSALYRRWTAAIEALGAVWTAVLLSLIYLVSVGPVSLFMRLLGRDLLDRRFDRPGGWHAHEPNPLGPQASARHQF